MRDHLLVTVAAVAILASATVGFPSVSLAQAPPTGPGIMISVGGSATISTEGMAPGGEIWAEWYSLPAGKVVEETAAAPKWAYVEVTLSGSAVITGDPAPMCRFLSAGGVQAESSEHTADPGDIMACNYAVLPASRTENRGSEPYVFAGLAVGGPWAEGMEDSGELYVKMNGLVKVAQVSTSEFGEVEKEILKTGAMTVTIRNVTMPAGSRIVKTDHYPTLRMVENGQLTFGLLPEGSDAAAGPKGPEVRKAFEMTEWSLASADKQIVLVNGGDQPVQFVEWTVAPAQSAKP
jgi:hypothetical protein